MSKKTHDQLYQELEEKYLTKNQKKKLGKAIKSRDYQIFEQEKIKGGELFEKLCKMARSTGISMTLAETDRKKLENQLSILSLDVKPEDIYLLGMLSLLGFAVLGIILFIPLGLPGLLVSMLGFAAFLYIKEYPGRLIQIRQARASSELILAVLYMVIYMRNTSNLEGAVKFVADNLESSLSNDFKKMLWDVSTRKYAGIKEALDDYVDKWADYAPVFIDAIHLIEASLYQPGEESRINTLNKSLDLTLEGTFESMTRYANALRMPINLLYMMGIMLPVLALVMFPIMGAFLSDIVTPGMLILMYNIGLPVGVYFFAQYSLAKRPAGFPVPDISNHPEVPKEGNFKTGNSEMASWMPAAITFILILLPGIAHIIFNASPRPQEIDVYMTLFLPLSPAIGLMVYARLLIKDRIKIREQISKIESEFAEAAFQLGNRLSEGYPLEISLTKVAMTLKESETANFFMKISKNINDLGMDVEKAVFDKKEGAINYYPSSVIKSVMKVAVMSAKKSMEVAAASLINMSNYLRDVHRIDEKVKDILSETLSSMKFQASFLAPVISGLVVGLTGMILIILDTLGLQVAELTTGDGGMGSFGGGTWILGIFQVSEAIPLWIFQPVVGIYVFEMILLLSMIDAQIELSADKLFLLKMLGTMIPIGMIIYVITTFAVTTIFVGIAKLAVSTGAFVG